MIVLDRTKLVEIFVLCDDFVKKLRELPSYHAEFLAMEESQMSKSELMAIVVFYHYSGFRCMKWYYEAGVRGALRSYFPRAFSYSHFVNSMRLVYQAAIIESVFELLTHQFDIDHTRHRSQHNAVINLVAGLVAYHFLENKPTAQKLYPQDFNKIVLF